jgi:hypothetical protein
MNKHLSLLFFVGTLLTFSQAYSQLTITTQLRTRAEFRDGQGTPLSKGAKPAFFLSQRSRLSALFNSTRIRTQVSLQDVRVWGQDVSTINRTTVQELNGIMLHEAWAELLLSDTSNKRLMMTMKIGRQELVYDDQRLVGNLDWLQQARRHDAAVFRFERSNIKLHAGFAFNQNKENNAGTMYNNTPPGAYAATTNGGTMYKSMQFLWANRALKQGSLSFLFFADQFSRFSNDSVNSIPTKVYKNGTWGRYTTGVHLEKKFGSLSTTTSAYYQFGLNASGQQTSAYLGSVGLSHKIRNSLVAVGVDYTSGSSSSTNNKTFDPLYGTPHKFWGLMDYFYAGNGFGKGGLLDAYVRYKFQPSKKLNFVTDLHLFRSASAIPSTNTKTLGQELDVVANYTLTPDISFEAGYAHFFVQDALAAPSVKNITNPKSGANWAYVMVNVRPSFVFK